ncbi:MAG: chorismate synthase, partial [Deltaproteobacteria bacterium]|nr:chorismate synthase [Deltaproteobacteria bacterium]
MSSNSFGTLFRVTTFGESHGPGLGAVMDGVPAGLSLSEEHIQKDLDLRRPGRSSLHSQRAEPDKVKILSGVYDGLTTGAPIALLIENQDARSDDYKSLQDIFRPGHADYCWQEKFGLRDWRGGGRSSGRETVARVAAGALARLVLEAANIKVTGIVSEIGGIKADTGSSDWSQAREHPLRCPDEQAAAEMKAAIETAQKNGDSVGGVIEVRASGVPAGLGEPVFDKLDARLGAAILSIGAVKGVEIGDGFALARTKGSSSNDLMDPPGNFRTNHAGGILGGISNGA